MHSTVLVCLSVLALTAATLVDNKHIFVYDEGNSFILVNQDGRTVQILMEKVEGQKGMKSIRIQVAGPNVTTRVVTFDDEQVKKTEKSEDKYQSEILTEILKQYHGAVEIGTFEQLVKSIEKHMQLGVLNKYYFYALEFLTTRNLETIQEKNPLIQLNKNQQSYNKDDMFMNQLPTRYGRMHNENRMDTLYNTQDSDIYNKMLMQKYKNTYGSGYSSQYEQEAMLKALLEKEMEEKYSAYKRMMMDDRTMSEYPMMGQYYEKQYYPEPENWYGSKYGTSNKYGMMNQYDTIPKYDTMNKYGRDTYDTKYMTNDNMLRKVLYKYPEAQDAMQSQKYQWTSPMDYNNIKPQHMYENQYMGDHQNAMMGYKMTHEPMAYSMNMRQNKNYDDSAMSMREKMMMMMMKPSTMGRKSYEGQMLTNESPMVDRYSTSRKDYPNIAY